VDTALLKALGGGWPVAVASIGVLLYRCYCLWIGDRMHRREVESDERRHALEVRLAWGAVQLGASATFEQEGISVTPAVPPAKAILDPAPEIRAATPSTRTTTLN